MSSGTQRKLQSVNANYSPLIESNGPVRRIADSALLTNDFAEALGVLPSIGVRNARFCAADAAGQAVVLGEPMRVSRDVISP
jgi:hypothetical protein